MTTYWIYLDLLESTRIYLDQLILTSQIFNRNHETLITLYKAKKKKKIIKLNSQLI